jgi:thiamine-phosphate pyrophosphorylase
VDYVGIGTVFESALKPHLQAGGLRNLERVLDVMGLVPGFAIGGIDAANVPRVMPTGVHGVAVGSAICAARDPVQATRLLRFAISREVGW